MQQAKYIRLYSDEAGESHFEDLEVDLIPLDFAPPAAPLNIAQFLPVAQSFWVGAAPDWEGVVAHPSPRRQIFCTLRGSYQVAASDGSVRHVDTGDILLLEDTSGKGHSTQVTSSSELLIFAVTLADS